ncbi:lysine-specific permease [Cladochytrium replicatum]|nr:lysine-specific permease [Cladochytrium replicatum]
MGKDALVEDVTPNDPAPTGNIDIDVTIGTGGVHRKLQPRHIQMIAIGGTIGTGLFVASGATIMTAGPLGSLLAFIIVGIQVWGVVTSLGEMAAFIPNSGAFNHFASRFVDDALGFTVGWNYWFQWAMTLPAELVALGIILAFWAPQVSSWIWALISVIFLFGMNALGVQGFGELEYWLSLIKVLAIIVFLIVAILVDAGAIGDRVVLGFKYWTIENAPINSAGVLSIFTAFTTAFYSYGGTELVGITAGEAANPRKSVPKAINSTFWRILLFYVSAIFMLGLIVPNNDPDLPLASGYNAATAAFTLAFKRAGLPFGADFMNAVILVAVVSAGNSSLYASTRTLISLSEDGLAPKWLGKVDKRGVPMVGLIITTLIGCIAFLGAVFGDGVVFSFLSNVLGIATLLTWVSVSITHLRFRAGLKKAGIPLSALPYRAPLHPLGDVVSIVISIIVLAGLLYLAFTTEFSVIYDSPYYIGLPIFIVLGVGYKLIKKSKVVKAEDMDFVSGYVPIDCAFAEPLSTLLTVPFCSLFSVLPDEPEEEASIAKKIANFLA